MSRAADIINDAWDESGNHWPGGVAAKALADAGLLVTDEIQAVLDAAVAWAADGEPRTWEALNERTQRVLDAVDAYLATKADR